ncbi:MAG: hypothetical protein ACL7AY_15685 [Candidatus Arsenophonus phytopathogenicus]
MGLKKQGTEMTVSSSNIKSNITKLKNKVLSINKDEIFCSQALDELYGLVERLNNLDLNSHKSKEILLSQSFANRFITKLNKNLNLETITNNSLLKDILMANYIVKITYHNLVEFGYRSESELAILAENITDLKIKNEEYDELLNKASKLKSFENEISDIEEILENIKSLNQEIEENRNSISEKLNQCSEETESITELKESSEETLQLIQSNQQLINEQLKEIEEQKNLFDKNKSTLAEIINRNERQFEIQHSEIQKIINDANRASMAGSFKRRKDEITKGIWLLDSITYTVLIVIFYCLWNIFNSSYHNDMFSIHFITRISVMSPLIWLAWITSRKSTYQTIIREDYAYKYSSAMAFEGYKKQTQEISPDLQKKLLEIAIVNLGDNPIRLYNNKVKHTPIDYEKIIEELKLFSKDKLDDSLK